MSAVRAEQAQETGEPEDLESFRQRVQGFLQDNFRQVTMEELRWDFHADEAEELAEIAHERELQRALFDAGLAGLCFPREYGGQGLSPAHQQVLNEELAGYEYPRRIQIPTFSPCATVILEFGTEEQKRRHLPAILRGEELWMQFLSEPSGGSDVAGALTTAVRDGRPVGAERVQGMDDRRVVVRLGPVPRPHQLGRAQAPRAHRVHASRSTSPPSRSTASRC